MMPTVIFQTQTYVALAGLLSPDLRLQASSAGLCYFQVEQSIGATDFRVQVAALAHYLNGSHSRRVFTAFLSADEVAQALPYERELQCIPTCDLREQVEQHVKRICPALFLREERHMRASVRQTRAVPRDEPLVSLPELFISLETAKDAMEVIDEPPHGGSDKRRWTLQYVWLQAAVMMARRQMESAKWSMQKKLRTSYSTLHTYLCRIFEACHQRYRVFADARPAYSGHRQVGWYIRVSMPLALLVA